MTAIAVAAWLGAAADTRGPGYAIWHLGSAAFALAFNLGSFVVEYAVIVAHVRLLAELKDRADRLREERYGPQVAHAGEAERQALGARTDSPVPSSVEGIGSQLSPAVTGRVITPKPRRMGGSSQSMRPLGVIVLIVLVDLLGFTLVMPLLGPFAAHYRFQRVADRLVVLGVSGLPARGRPDPGPAERSLWPPAAPDLQPGGNRPVVSDPGPVARLHRDAPGSPARRRLGGQHPGRAGVRRRRDGARGPSAGHGIDRHGLRAGVRARAPPGRRAPQLAARRRLAAPAAVPGGRGFLDPGVGARPDSAFPSRGRRVSSRARRRACRAGAGSSTRSRFPAIGRLILIGFLAVLAFAAFEGTFALFLLRRMNWDARTAAFAFAGIGFLSAVVQGGLIRRLVPRFGEAQAHRDGARAGRLRIRRHGDRSRMLPSWPVP